MSIFDLENLFRSMNLNIEDNKSITEVENGVKSIVHCNNRPIIVDTTGIAHIVFGSENKPIVFNTHSKVKDCSYLFMEKYIHKVLSSKVNFMVSKILELCENPELYDQVKSQKLNKVLLKLIEDGHIKFNNTGKTTLLNKWKKVVENISKKPIKDVLIGLNHTRISACIEDEKEVEFYRKIYKVPETQKVTFSFFDAHTSVEFPLYKLLKQSKDKLFGVQFEKHELEVIKIIFQYLFKDIDAKDAYSLSKESSSKGKEKNSIDNNYIIKNPRGLPAPTMLIIETFNSLASHIDTILDDIGCIGETYTIDKKFNLNLAKSELDAIKSHSKVLINNNYGSIHDYKSENELNLRIDIEEFNKQLNESSLKSENQTKKAQKKPTKRQASRNRSLSIPMSGFAVASMFRMEGFKIASNILDPTNENFEYMIPIGERLRHTYVLAGSGAGKTTLLESLLYNDCQKLDQSTIIFDLMGKATNSVLKFVDDPNRLLIIDPHLHKLITPVINPFEIENRDDEIAIENRTKAIINATDIALNLKDGWSINQRAKLEPCISTLIRAGGYSFEDLQRMMNDEINHDLVALGKKSPIKAHRDFFNNEFHKESYKVTKDAISARIQVFLNDPTFANMTTGKSTINLKKEINTKGKVIVFKLSSKQKLFARLMMEMIQDMMKERANIPDDKITHSHIYLDEFQNYVTPTIEEMLSESRNYKCYVTFAHQSFVQLHKKMQGIVLTNSNIKIIGQCSYDDGKKMSKNMKADFETIENLHQGEFVFKIGAKPVVQLKNTDKFINDKTPYHHKKRTKHMKHQLKQKYYVYKQIMPIECEDSANSKQLEPKYDEF